MLVLASLILATYLTSVSGSSMTPFLLDIASDLDVDMGAIGVMLALSSVTWAIVSLFAGVASDRLGRRPIIIIGLVGMALGPLVLAATSMFSLALVARFFNGFGGGAFMGPALAAAADAARPTERGRAIGWMITGQSLALVIGVPMVAYLGALIGWRGALALQGAAVLVAGVLVWFAVPGQSRRERAEGEAGGALT